VWARRWLDTDRGLEPVQAPLLAAIAERVHAGPLTAFDIGCGPGSTTIAVANALPKASIIAADISAALVEVARARTAGLSNVRVVEGDAEQLAGSEGPFDLFFSRHGVMFFADPVRAFRSFHSASSPGAPIVFSCFQSWGSNPWASELANAAAGKPLPPPGRESGGFAFADPDYVLKLLGDSRWRDAQRHAVSFRYVVGEGENAADEALSFMTEIGPASRILESLPEAERKAAVERMRGVIEQHAEAGGIVFPAAAWIWSAFAS